MSRIAVIGPAPSGNGATLGDVLRRFGPDEGYATDVASARVLLGGKVAERPAERLPGADVQVIALGLSG
ncbi:hypothetical protein ACFWIQ_22300 [Kitasatospora sp. NPDC127059]|uniref:hypothetical protein n=1 Tax=unclassified Kitasatospora TaxID=2633591 RepID=UPI003666E6BF